MGLWLHPETSACQGVGILKQQELTWLSAPMVILATGGGGQVYAQTTNPALSTGDGVAMAWRRGAALRDLEFFQFHPTALTVPGAPRFLISEAVRGEGAHLLDSQHRRFMFDYHPLGELAPRDIVSRSIFLHLQAMRQTNASSELDHVWLDLRPIPPDKIRRRFPKIIEVCQTWGIDVFAQPVPVAPAAHYWMGGIVTDIEGRTTIPGLYAVGEVASTGVHGANRLASNSLLECLVFGAQFAKMGQIERSIPSSSDSALQQIVIENWEIDEAVVAQIHQALPSLLWRYAGICREAEGLKTAIAQITQWREQFEALELTRTLMGLTPGVSLSLPAQASTQIRLWAETQNLLDNAGLILKSALFRTESRGGHYRLDYPDTKADWQAHTVVKGNDWFKSMPVDEWKET
jgi:L-aspartate oxidase